MPRYEYGCERCNVIFEETLSMSVDSSIRACPKCAMPSNKIFCVPQMILTKTTHPGSRPQRYPFVDENITGSPIEITTPEQHGRLLRKHELEPIPFRGDPLAEYRVERYAKLKEAKRKRIGLDKVNMPVRPKRRKIITAEKKAWHKEIERTARDVYNSLQTNSSAVTNTA